MKVVWTGLSSLQPQALKDSPLKPVCSLSLWAGKGGKGWGHSSDSLWEMGEACRLSPHTRGTVTHTPKPSQLDVRFAKPNASLMRSTFSPRRS